MCLHTPTLSASKANLPFSSNPTRAYMNRPVQFSKPDLKPKKYHGYAVVLFILGSLLPPLAVAARFGIGRDFFINLILTICGYIPGHVHNFYIQNIRNNKNRQRTPKWAIRYGLVDTSEIERKQRKSQWANRYNERLPHSTLENREVEEGQNPSRSVDSIDGDTQRLSDRTAGLWNETDESYYGRDDSSSSLQNGSSRGRWHYPTNFDNMDPLSLQDSGKVKKDRWSRTEDARRGIGLEDPGRRKKKKKKSRTVDNSSDFIDNNRQSLDSFGQADATPGQLNTSTQGEGRGEFDHEF